MDSEPVVRLGDARIERDFALGGCTDAAEADIAVVTKVPAQAPA